MTTTQERGELGSSDRVFAREARHDMNDNTEDKSIGGASHRLAAASALDHPGRSPILIDEL